MTNMGWRSVDVFTIPMVEFDCLEGGKTRPVCSLDVVGSSGILKAKQKLGVTFNFDKQDVIDFTKFSKMTMCRVSEANS